MKTEDILKIIAGVAREKKAEDIIALDMRGISSLADFFFLCSAENTRQAAAIGQEIRARLKEAGLRLLRTEGLPPARWLVMDYGIVLVHVFLKNAREYYSLETLWGDAPRLEYSNSNI